MPPKIEPRYVAEVDVSGGRVGHAVSTDGVLDVVLRRPNLNGVSEGTNPEQLFGAAWGACFLGALGLAGKEAEIDVTGASAHVAIGIGEDPDLGGSALCATIAISLPGVELTQVQELADRAHEICPYSKATRGNIEVIVTAVEG